MSKCSISNKCVTYTVSATNPETVIREPNGEAILRYSLILTTNRITLDILFQNPLYRYFGPDDGDYWSFKATNGYEVISRSRTDIQTERIWLLGGKNDAKAQRSGTLAVPDSEECEVWFNNFHQALQEWAEHMYQKLKEENG
jgi:hypothetical protein